MNAVIEIKGKQYRVSSGQTIRTLQVSGEPGDSVDVVRVLATFDGDNVNVGKPALDGVTVPLTIVRHAKSPKIHIFKYKNKSNWSRRIGYRDKISYLRVGDIKVK